MDVKKKRTRQRQKAK